MVESIKNPKSGTITVDQMGEMIRDNPVMECQEQVFIRKGKAENQQPKI